MKKNLTKTIITLLSVVALSTIVKAQKLEKPVVDPIKGTTRIDTKEETLFNWMKKLEVCSSLVKQDTSKGFALLLHTTDVGGVYTVNENDKTFIKLDNGSVITLNPNLKNNFGINSHVGDTRQLWISYILTPEQLKQLTDSKIVFIRISTTSSGNKDYEIKDSKANIIEKQLQLLASN